MCPRANVLNEEIKGRLRRFKEIKIKKTSRDSLKGIQDLKKKELKT
jgi:hypothetical protein